MAGLAAARMFGGTEFHAAGLVCKKACPPNLVHSRGITCYCCCCYACSKALFEVTVPSPVIQSGIR